MRVHWSPDGSQVRAIDYQNPDEETLRHVRFVRPQVVMITPEEVIAHGEQLTLVQSSRAAILDLGRSNWLQSFHGDHLVHCHHYQLLFYDDLFEVICEGVSCHDGGFSG